METLAPPEPMALNRFSTDWLPTPHRLEIWREVFGREVIRLDLAPLNDQPVHCDVTFREIDRMTLSLGCVSAISCDRTHALLTDGNDDIVLMIPVEGTITLEVRGRELTAGMGDVLVRRSDDACTTYSSNGRYMTLTLPVRELERRVARIDQLTMAVLPAASEGVRLLAQYARMILFDTDVTPEMSRMIHAHIADIAALAIGAQRDAWHHAEQRGMKATRLRAIHAAIRAEAAGEGFSINTLARQSRISPGYIRKLLAGEGTSFTALVLERRLQLAHDALVDPALATRTISAIALDCGFGDVSYFNRAFRKRYDATPGDVRANALRC